MCDLSTRIDQLKLYYYEVHELILLKKHNTRSWMLALRAIPFFLARNRYSISSLEVTYANLSWPLL